MGAALTYARRYALFTLVGIAGEDDLNAPDLPMFKPNRGAASPAAKEMNGSVAAPHDSTVAAENRSLRRSPVRPAKLMLDAEASASCEARCSYRTASAIGASFARDQKSDLSGCGIALGAAHRQSQ
jgi:hypothetical protein